MIYAVLHHGVLSAYRTHEEAVLNHGDKAEVLNLLEAGDVPAQGDAGTVVHVVPKPEEFWSLFEGKK